MAKPSQGRFSGLHGMTTWTAAELFSLADRLEAEANDPESGDDPKWQRRRAARVRRVAEAKEKAAEHKAGQGRD